VLFADAEAAARAVPDMPRPTPVWAVAAMRADEYDARTQSSNQDYVDDNEWLDDVSPVREVNTDRSVRAEPSFGDMRFDENLGLVELDSQPLIPMASPASVELVDAEGIDDLEQEFEDAPEPVHEFESVLESEQETHQAPDTAFVFGSAIAPQSEFDLEMANDALADDQDNFDDQDDDDDSEDNQSSDEEDEFADDGFNDEDEDEDFDESNVTQNWFVDDVDHDEDSEPEPEAERVVLEIDDQLDELLHERGVSTDVDYSIVIPQPEPV
jgi:hypothetical protein